MSTVLYITEMVREKRKSEEDAGKPKRNITAYFHYIKHRRHAVVSSHPEYKLGTISKVIAKEWRELEQEAKAKWQKVAEEDKKRYNEEMKQWKQEGQEAGEESGKKG